MPWGEDYVVHHAKVTNKTKSHMTIEPTTKIGKNRKIKRKLGEQDVEAI